MYQNNHERVKHKRKVNSLTPGSQISLLPTRATYKAKRFCIQRSVFFPATVCTAVRTSEKVHRHTARLEDVNLFQCISQQPVTQSRAEKGSGFLILFWHSGSI